MAQPWEQSLTNWDNVASDVNAGRDANQEAVARRRAFMAKVKSNGPEWKGGSPDPNQMRLYEHMLNLDTERRDKPIHSISEEVENAGGVASMIPLAIGGATVGAGLAMTPSIVRGMAPKMSQAIRQMGPKMGAASEAFGDFLTKERSLKSVGNLAEDWLAPKTLADQSGHASQYEAVSGLSNPMTRAQQMERTAPLLNSDAPTLVMADAARTPPLGSMPPLRGPAGHTNDLKTAVMNGGDQANLTALGAGDDIHTLAMKRVFGGKTPLAGKEKTIREWNPGVPLR